MCNRRSIGQVVVSTHEVTLKLTKDKFRNVGTGNLKLGYCKITILSGMRFVYSINCFKITGAELLFFHCSCSEASMLRMKTLSLRDEKTFSVPNLVDPVREISFVAFYSDSPVPSVSLNLRRTPVDLLLKDTLNLGPIKSYFP